MLVAFIEVKTEDHRQCKLFDVAMISFMFSTVSLHLCSPLPNHSISRLSWITRTSQAISSRISVSWKEPSFLSRNMSGYIPAAAATESNSQGFYFSDNGINRAAEYRNQTSWLHKAFSDSTSLVVPVVGEKNLLKKGKPLIISTQEIGLKKNLELHEVIFLGLFGTNELPVFAFDISDYVSLEESTPSWLEGTELVDLRRHMSNMKSSEAALLGYARGLMEWQNKNKFCGQCGTKTSSHEGGHSLKCTSESCNRILYPRLDPAVIMVVSHGDYILLGRQSKWQRGRYSILAGFVEIGETFEMAIQREVKEEVGLNIDKGSVRYIASQPWPFPSSLMIGFSATTLKCEHNSHEFSPSPDGEIIPVDSECLAKISTATSLPTPVANKDELEDARWFHKDFIKSVLFGNYPVHGLSFNLPGKHAIAHHMIEKWVTEKTTNPWAGDDVANIEIDEGIFKYVLLRIQDDGGNCKLIVRGSSELQYHADILKQTKDIIGKLGIKVEAMGGGRIEHNPEKRVLRVYGYSQAFGQANHKLTAALLQQWLPFHEISISWDGY